MTPLPFAIPLMLITAAALGCGAYHLVVWWRIRRAAQILPRLADGLTVRPPEGAGAERVCIIVPAHNEQEVIELIAGSLLKLDYPADRLQLVFCLDRCTDRTEALLRAALSRDNARGVRADIISITACPEGWAGKTHAMWRGVRDAALAPSTPAPDFLLFVDADTILAPDLLNAAIGSVRAHGYDLLSLLPTLTSGRSFERTIQPAAGFELIRQYPMDVINRPGASRAFANGQFMLFKRESYEKIGGHEAVHNELLEDIALARLVRARQNGMRLGVLFAEDLLMCRMYPTYAAFRRGWKRIYTESCRQRPARLREFAWRLRLTATLLPCSAGLAVPLGAVEMGRGDYWLGGALLCCGALGLTAFLGVIGILLHSQRVPTVFAAAFPFGAWVTGGIMLEAAHDLKTGAGTTWAGRTYTREVRA